MDDLTRELLEEAGIDPDALRPDLTWLDEIDDPEVLRGCLRRQRLAASAAQQAHTARAVVAEIHVDPERPLDVRVVLSTPDGDRAKEQELGAVLMHQAIACILLKPHEREVLREVFSLDAKVSAGELDAAEAWRRLAAVVGEEQADG